MMKHFFIALFMAAMLFVPTLAFAQDAAQCPNGENSVSVRDIKQEWQNGLGFYLGGGGQGFVNAPGGYTAYFGCDFHLEYVGLGLEISWNTLWASEDKTKRELHSHTPYKTTNSGLLLAVHGYLPTIAQFIFTAEAAIGLGVRYDKTFSDSSAGNYNGGSWISHIALGGFYLFDCNLTLGFQFDINIGNFLPNERRWSDEKTDYEVGISLHLSYQLFDL